MTSQARSKSIWLTIWCIWFCRALQPYQMKISQNDTMDRVWDTSRYHPKLFVSIFKVKVIQGHEVKGRSNRKFCVWAACYMFLCQFLRQKRENGPRTLFDGPNWTKFENRENAEFPGNSVKMTVIQLQITKSRSFFKISTQNNADIMRVFPQKCTV